MEDSIEMSAPPQDTAKENMNEPHQIEAIAAPSSTVKAKVRSRLQVAAILLALSVSSRHASPVPSMIKES